MTGDKPSATKPAGPVAPQPQPSPDEEEEAEPEPSPTPPSEAPPSEVDLLTVSTLEARIVALNKVGWVPCGRKHSVAAVEVEVLGVGEPPPHMFLYISCPVDGGRNKLLVPDARLSVELFAGKQSWPKPPVDVGDLPVRYVKDIETSSVTAEPT